MRDFGVKWEVFEEKRGEFYLNGGFLKRKLFFFFLKIFYFILKLGSFFLKVFYLRVNYVFFF